jgi:NAD(P)-dependent dehydrogenase (short-subunit alcohol dehydrogenase family)
MLQDGLALVTRAGQGNGLAIAKGLAVQVAPATATDINERAAREAAGETACASGRAVSCALDVLMPFAEAAPENQLDAEQEFDD